MQLRNLKSDRLDDFLVKKFELINKLKMFVYSLSSGKLNQNSLFYTAVKLITDSQAAFTFQEVI